MEISIFLAKIVGFYLIIKLIAVWKNYDKLPSIIEGLKNNDALRLSVGLITAILGFLIVLSHNIWTWDYRVIITIIGWLVLIKGSLISFSGAYLDKMSGFLFKKSSFYLILILSVILAVFLLCKGYNY